MIRKVKLAITLLILASAGCATLPQRARLDIRPAEKSSSALASSPDMMQAQAMLRRGEFALAIDSYRRALREKPDDADALNGLAVCYASLGRYDLSQGYFERALANAPTDLRIYRNLARSLESQGKTEDAAGVLKEVALLQSKPAGTTVPHESAQEIPPPLAQFTDERAIFPSARQVAPETQRLALASVTPLAVAPRPPRLPTSRLERRLTVPIPHQANAILKVGAPRITKPPIPSLQSPKPRAAPRPLLGAAIPSVPKARVPKPKLQARLLARIIDRTGDASEAVMRRQPAAKENMLFSFMRCLPLLFPVGKAQCSAGGA